MAAILEQPTREQEFETVIKEAREQGLLEGEEKPAKEPEKVDTKPTEGKVRDESGKFVKQEAKPEEPKEPFAGFKDLPKDVQDQWNTVLGRTKSLESELAVSRRQNAALMGRVPQLQSELARLQNSGRQVASPEKATKLTAQLKRFEEYKERYPEDAAAIEELIGSARQELAETKAQLADKVSQLENRLGSFESERTVQENFRVQDQLDREHPQWRVIAGWVDGEGNAVEPTSAQWHPHFEAWRRALPPEIQDDYKRKLDTRNATLIGHVLEAFERDYEAAVKATEGGAEPASDADPVRSRRSEALRDVSPTGSAPGSGPADKPILSPRMSREDEYAAVVAQFRDRFPHWNTG